MLRVQWLDPCCYSPRGILSCSPWRWYGLRRPIHWFHCCLSEWNGEWRMTRYGSLSEMNVVIIRHPRLPILINGILVQCINRLSCAPPPTQSHVHVSLTCEKIILNMPFASGFYELDLSPQVRVDFKVGKTKRRDRIRGYGVDLTLNAWTKVGIHLYISSSATPLPIQALGP